MNIRGRTGAAVAVVCAVLATPAIAQAASLFVAPERGTLTVDVPFEVTIRMNSQWVSVNAAQGVLTFNPEELQVDTVSTDGSIFNLNVQRPDYSNTEGTVDFAGVILNPGYAGPSGTLLTVTFHPVRTGAATIALLSGSVLANDGQGTEVLSDAKGAVYFVIAAIPTLQPGAVPAGSAWPRRIATLPLSVKLLGSVALGFLLARVLWWLWFGFLWLIAAAVRRRKRRGGEKFDEILSDIDSEVALIDRLGKSRPLYPEESHLKKKLSEYRASLRRMTHHRHMPRRDRDDR